MLTNLDKRQPVASESLNFNERIRALRSDLESLGQSSRTFLPNIQRFSNGLQSSLKHKLKELQSRDQGLIDPASTAMVTEFAEVQNMIERTKERFNQDEAVVHTQERKDEVLSQIFSNPQNADPLTLGKGRWLQNYFEVERAAWEVNDLSLQINAGEARNRSTMIAFLRDSDSLLTQTGAFLDDGDLAALSQSTLGLPDSQSFQAKPNSQTLTNIKQYMRSKHQLLPSILGANRTMKDGYFTLNQSGSKPHSFMSQAGSRKNETLVNSDTTLTPEQKTVDYYLIHEKLRPNLQNLLERLKIDEPRGCEPIYDIILRIAYRINQEPRAVDWGLADFLVYAVNSMILESCLYIQTAFWNYIQGSFPIVGCADLPKAVADNFGRLLSFVNAHLSRFPETLFTKDGNNLPVWALLFFAIRAGLFEDVFVFCSSYNGSLEEEVRAFGVSFLTHLRSLKIDFAKGKEERVSEYLTNNQQLVRQKISNDFSDDFRAGLTEIFEHKETLVKETLAPRVLDAIWYRLFSSFESLDGALTFRIFNLQSLIRGTDWSVQADLAKNVPFYNILSLMFDDCPLVLRDLQKNSSDALKVAFLVTETRLSAIMRTYARLAGKEPPVKPASKFLIESAMAINRNYWENAVALINALPTSADRQEALLQYSKTHHLFQLMFDFEIPKNQSPNSLKSLVQPAEFRAFVAESLQTFRIRDDWKNFSFLANALIEIGNWKEFCGLFINLKYEQIKRIVNNDTLDAADFDRIRTHIDRVFREFVPAEFKSDPYYKAAGACEDIKTLFFDVVARKATDRFDRIKDEEFRTWNSAILLPSYHLVYLNYVNLALKICLNKIRTASNKGETQMVQQTAEKFEKFQGRMPDEKAIKNETKKSEIVRLKHENVRKAMEVKGSIQRYN